MSSHKSPKFGIQLAILIASLATLTRTEFLQGTGPELRIANAPTKPPHLKPATLINKITLTQKGYIQFLRYITDVPLMTEFTFCIWLRSANLTHAHPLLSYSRHEEERYLRAWISGRGKDISLAILEKEVFRVPVHLRENRWYHICQSWEAQGATWTFYLNGKLKSSGSQAKLKNLKIPSGGDIVVGQEYTDFDKGLDDGIEGDIFGFNLVLSSTTTPIDFGDNLISPYEFGQRRIFNPDRYETYQVPRAYPYRHRQQHHPQHYHHPNPHYRGEEEEEGVEVLDGADDGEIPSVLSYFTALGANREPKGFLEIGQTLFQNLLEWLQPQESRVRIWAAAAAAEEGPHYYYQQGQHEQRRQQHQELLFEPYRGPSQQDWSNKRIMSGNSRIVSDISGADHKPLGLQLVELSYNCALGKGSPINHEKVVVSWTKTPVRVFGGAVLKNVKPFCTKAR